MLNSDGRSTRTWREIAEEASHEQDPARLLELTKELERALAERERAESDNAGSKSKS